MMGRDTYTDTKQRDLLSLLFQSMEAGLKTLGFFHAYTALGNAHIAGFP
jgi:hypothetical protein